MDTKAIGQYIQLLRKQKTLSQKELADKLGVSFQAVSKWETGENLPDASILLDLAYILETTTDRILNGGNSVLRVNRNINVSDIREGFASIENLKKCFGETSPIYLGAIEGINSKLGINVEEYMKNEEKREILIANAIIQYLTDGYYIEEADIDASFVSMRLSSEIKKHMHDCELFRNKAGNYTDFRPAYPSGAVELIFSVKENPVIADIGSGTGKLSQLCVDRARILYAVEPNAQMRHSAKELLSGKENYRSVAAFAEKTTLADHSVDVITVAEAFHWFDNDAAKAEFKRILKSGGYVFLLWNVFGGAVYDKDKEEIDKLYNKPTGIVREKRAVNLFGEGNYRITEFDNSFFQTCEEFCTGWSSASYIPDKGTKAHEDFLNKARALFEKYSENGMLETKVTTVCFWGRMD